MTVHRALIIAATAVVTTARFDITAEAAEAVPPAHLLVAKRDLLADRSSCACTWRRARRRSMRW